MIDWSTWPPHAVDRIVTNLLRAGISDSLHIMESRRIIPSEMLFGTGVSRIWDRWALNSHQFRMRPMSPAGAMLDERDMFWGMPIRHRAFPDRPIRSTGDGVDFLSEIRIAAHGFGSIPLEMRVVNHPVRLALVVETRDFEHNFRSEQFSYTYLREAVGQRGSGAPGIGPEMHAVAFDEFVANSADAVHERKAPQGMSDMRIAWLT